MKFRIIKVVFLIFILFITENAIANEIFIGEYQINENKFQLLSFIENGELFLSEKILKDKNIPNIRYPAIETLNIYHKNIYKFRANQEDIRYNNQNSKIETPIRYLEDIFFIPYDFLQSELNINLISKNERVNRIITKNLIKEVNFKEELIVKMTEKSEFKIEENEKQIIIKFKDTKFKNTLLNRTTQVNDGLIYNFRLKEKGYSKIIIEKVQPFNYNLDLKEIDEYYYFILSPPSQIEGLSFVEEGITLKTSRELEDINFKFLNNDNEGLQMKLFNTILNTQKQEYFIDNEIIQKVSLRQNNKDVLINFTLNKWFNFNVSPDKTQPNKLVIKPHKLIDILDIKVSDDRLEIITNENILPISYILEKGNRLVFDFPNSILRKSNKSFEIKNELINQVRVSQFEKETVRAVIDLVKLIDYEVETINYKGNYKTIINLKNNPNNIKNKEENFDFNIFFDNKIEYIKNEKEKIKNKSIVIDPGHGGYDPGAISPNNIMEKNIVLDIALYLKHFLNETNVEVYMTRNNDSYISLNERINKSNQLKPNAFISIHANSSLNTNAKGFETFIPSINSSYKNEVLANYIQKQNIINSNFKDRGVQVENFYVLNNSNYPAVLIEAGFLSNFEDESKLRNEKNRQKIAWNIYLGIYNYLKEEE